MLITKITARNFKTYKELELDLEVENEKPIVLVGGDNGGGKTTLFQAIYYALYGLEIEDEEHFKRLLNAGVPYERNVKIELEIDFKGKVLSQDYFYKIKRLYTVNASGLPVESVSLNFNGDTFTYGTATPFSERQKIEAEVNKIIKANLPKELSRYFLFDAMESGNLLKKDYLTRVIKENIESVMGFKKYSELSHAALQLKESYIASSIELQSERDEYQKLINRRFELQEKIKELTEEQQIKLGYSVSQQELYRKAKEGKNLQDDYNNQIKYLESKIQSVKIEQESFLTNLSKYVESVEVQAFLPKLIDSIRSELELIISANTQLNASNLFSSEQLNQIAELLSKFIKERQLSNDLSTNFNQEFKNYIKEYQKSKTTANEFDYFSDSELDTINLLLNKTSINNFGILSQQKDALVRELNETPKLIGQLDEIKAQLTEGESSTIAAYEENERKLAEIKDDIKNLSLEVDKITKEINRFDISEEEIPNPKLELLKKVEPMFEEISQALLKAKKTRIEDTMKEDLNTTLVAYQNQIKKVSLSENLSDLSFKIYHNAGNEIYLEELNAASKQIIVQVLLKSLHQFGDYNPPVMIDTVMGYLGEKSRASLLENYFPKLSHQTILLSTDSEIRKDKDLIKIEEFISKKYTLIRDAEKQLTVIEEGYFND